MKPEDTRTLRGLSGSCQLSSLLLQLARFPSKRISSKYHISTITLWLTSSKGSSLLEHYVAFPLLVISPGPISHFLAKHVPGGASPGSETFLREGFSLGSAPMLDAARLRRDEAASEMYSHNTSSVLPTAPSHVLASAQREERCGESPPRCKGCAAPALVLWLWGTFSGAGDQPRSSSPVWGGSDRMAVSTQQ